MENPAANAAPLRIALLNDSFPPTIDGVANVVLNYARLLTAAGHTVCVATPAYPGVEDDYPFPVYRYPSFDTTEATGYRAGAPFSPELLQTLADFHPDVIHTHCPVMSAVLARMLSPLVNAPIIFTYHTKFDADIQNAIKGRLLQEASIKALVNNISAADEVWTVSDGAGQNLRGLGYTGPWRIMENGVDFPRGLADEAAVAAAREKWGIPTDRPVFLFVGRMMWYKGFQTSLEALLLAADAGCDFRFVLVGDGADRQEIQALAEQLGLAERCIFTGAVRDREELRAIFGTADLFLFPSVFDTNGIVVREAAACGCASLLVADSCAAEGIADGETGYLFDGTPQDMARRIAAVCADTADARQVGKRAMDGIYLSWQAAVVRAAARYRQVAANWSAGTLGDARAPGDQLLKATGTLLTDLGRLESRMEAAGADLKEGLAQAVEDYRENLADARQELSQAKAALKEELAQKKAELKEELAQVKADVKEGVAHVKKEIKEEIAQIKAELKGDNTP